MKTKGLLVAMFTAALLLAPAAWSHEGMEGMEGMDHGSMRADAVSGTAKAGARHEQKRKKAKKAGHARKEAKMAKHVHYVCPMHDGGEGDKPGPCPKCGMEMVEEALPDGPAAGSPKREHHQENPDSKPEK